MRTKTSAVMLCGIAICFVLAFGPSRAEEVRQYVTPSGQKFWYFSIKEAKRTAVAISWPAGLSKLPKGQEMVGRIGTELMLNGGAAGKSAEQIVADFGDLDAGARLFVQPEDIRGFIVAPNEELVNAAAIANDVLAKPNLSEKWFKRERANLVKNSKGREVAVVGLAWNLSREILMGDHSNKRFWSIRPSANIESIQHSAIQTWHQNSFVSTGLTIVGSGSEVPELVGVAIDRALQGLPNTDAPAPVPMQNLSVLAKTVILHVPDAPKSMIMIIGNLPPGKANQDLPLNISLGVLGWGKQSRLFKAVRTGLRATYGFGAGYFDYTRHHRILRMSGEVETAKLQTALDKVGKTYEKFRESGIGIVEFPFARRFYYQRVTKALTMPTEATFMLLESRINGRSDDDLNTLVKRVNALERGRVNHFIKQTFPPFSKLMKIVVTPDADAVEGDCVIMRLEDWQMCK